MIPKYIVLALISMFLVGVTDFVYSMAVRKGVSPATMTCSQGCIFFPMVTVWALLEGVYVWTVPALLGAASAFFIIFGIFAFMRSVHLGEASVVTPISQLSFVVSVLLATFWMKERITKRKAAGLLMAVATIVAFMPD